MDGQEHVTVRRATAADAALIHELVVELAIFERAPDAVLATPEDFLREGFGEKPAFECLIAESSGEALGFALFFENFSTWTGRRGIYLEDIFVRQRARGRGAGLALMRALAGIVLERGGARLDLWVLHWNPARRFYERLRFEQMRDWLPYRLSGAELRALAGASTEDRA